MADSGENQQSEQVCNFFRKPKNKNIRKRTIAEDEDEDSMTEGSMLLQQKKTPKADNKLFISTGSSKASMSSEADAEPVRPIFQYESSKEIQVQHDSRATATLETETDFSRDARAIRERALKQAEDAMKGKKPSVGYEKLYKGMRGYTDQKGQKGKPDFDAAQKGKE